MGDMQRLSASVEVGGVLVDKAEGEAMATAKAEGGTEPSASLGASVAGSEGVNKASSLVKGTVQFHFELEAYYEGALGDVWLVVRVQQHHTLGCSPFRNGLSFPFLSAASAQIAYGS